MINRGQDISSNQQRVLKILQICKFKMSAPIVLQHRNVKMNICELSQDFITKSTCLDSDNPNFSDERFVSLCQSLVNLTNSLKNTDNREVIQDEVVARICVCLKVSLVRAQELLDVSSHTQVAAPSTILQLSIEGARCLRNACAGSHRNQQIAACDPDLIQTLSLMTESSCKYVEATADPTLTTQVMLLLRCSTQMLGNYSAGNVINSAIVWRYFFSLFSRMLSYEDATLAAYSCMLLHSCILGNRTTHTAQLLETPGGNQIITDVLKYLSLHECEWGLYIVEILVTQPTFIENIWRSIDAPEKNLVLDIILTQMNKSHDSTSSNQNPPQVGLSQSHDKETANQKSSRSETSDIMVAMEIVQYICEEFKEKAHTILSLHGMNTVEKEESLFVIKLLETLCVGTSLRGAYPGLIRDDQLISCACNLLHCMQMIGREGANAFSDVSKVSELETADTEHPVYGLKCHLIRLLGNLAYRDTHNQNKVREQGGLNLIMDHTNIDARNPFIQQWSVFAMRNLLEGNHDNQAVVAGMQIEGMADNVAQLREFGVEARLDGDRIRVMDADKDQQSTFTKPADR